MSMFEVVIYGDINLFTNRARVPRSSKQRPLAALRVWWPQPGGLSRPGAVAAGPVGIDASRFSFWPSLLQELKGSKNKDGNGFEMP